MVNQKFDLVNHSTTNTIKLVSRRLKKFIELNDKIPNCNATLTYFHSKHVAPISIESYLNRILKYTLCGNECFLSVLVYFHRMSQIQNYIPSFPSSCKKNKKPFIINSYNIHRLLIAGVTVSAKFNSDIFFLNSHYAKVGGLPINELNNLEMEFLMLNNYDLHVSVEELQYTGDCLLNNTLPEPVVVHGIKRMELLSQPVFFNKNINKFALTYEDTILIEKKNREEERKYGRAALLIQQSLYEQSLKSNEKEKDDREKEDYRPLKYSKSYDRMRSSSKKESLEEAYRHHLSHHYKPPINSNHSLPYQPPNTLPYVSSKSEKRKDYSSSYGAGEPHRHHESQRTDSYRKNHPLSYRHSTNSMNLSNNPPDASLEFLHQMKKSSDPEPLTYEKTHKTSTHKNSTSRIYGAEETSESTRKYHRSSHSHHPQGLSEEQKVPEALDLLDEKVLKANFKAFMDPHHQLSDQDLEKYQKAYKTYKEMYLKEWMLRHKAQGAQAQVVPVDSMDSVDSMDPVTPVTPEDSMEALDVIEDLDHSQSHRIVRKTAKPLSTPSSPSTTSSSSSSSSPVLPKKSFKSHRKYSQSKAMAEVHDSSSNPNQLPNESIHTSSTSSFLDSEADVSSYPPPSKTTTNTTHPQPSPAQRLHHRQGLNPPQPNNHRISHLDLNQARKNNRRSQPLLKTRPSAPENLSMRNSYAEDSFELSSPKPNNSYKLAKKNKKPNMSKALPQLPTGTTGPTEPTGLETESLAPEESYLATEEESVNYNTTIDFSNDSSFFSNEEPKSSLAKEKKPSKKRVHKRLSRNFNRILNNFNSMTLDHSNKTDSDKEKGTGKERENSKGKEGDKEKIKDLSKGKNSDKEKVKDPSKGKNSEKDQEKELNPSSGATRVRKGVKLVERKIKGLSLSHLLKPQTTESKSGSNSSGSGSGHPALKERHSFSVLSLSHSERQKLSLLHGDSGKDKDEKELRTSKSTSKIKAKVAKVTKDKTKDKEKEKVREKQHRKSTTSLKKIRDEKSLESSRKYYETLTSILKRNKENAKKDYSTFLNDIDLKVTSSSNDTINQITEIYHSYTGNDQTPEEKEKEGPSSSSSLLSPHHQMNVSGNTFGNAHKPSFVDSDSLNEKDQTMSTIEKELFTERESHVQPQTSQPPQPSQSSPSQNQKHPAPSEYSASTHQGEFDDINEHTSSFYHDLNDEKKIFNQNIYDFNKYYQNKYDTEEESASPNYNSNPSLSTHPSHGLEEGDIEISSSTEVLNSFDLTMMEEEVQEKRRKAKAKAQAIHAPIEPSASSLSPSPSQIPTIEESKQKSNQAKFTKNPDWIKKTHSYTATDIYSYYANSSSSPPQEDQEKDEGTEVEVDHSSLPSKTEPVKSETEPVSELVSELVSEPRESKETSKVPFDLSRNTGEYERDIRNIKNFLEQQNETIHAEFSLLSYEDQDPTHRSSFATSVPSTTYISSSGKDDQSFSSMKDHEDEEKRVVSQAFPTQRPSGRNLSEAYPPPRLNSVPQEEKVKEKNDLHPSVKEEQEPTLNTPSSTSSTSFDPKENTLKKRGKEVVDSTTTPNTTKLPELYSELPTEEDTLHRLTEEDWYGTTEENEEEEEEEDEETETESQPPSQPQTTISNRKEVEKYHGKVCIDDKKSPTESDKKLGNRNNLNYIIKNDKRNGQGPKNRSSRDTLPNTYASSSTSTTTTTTSSPTTQEISGKVKGPNDLEIEENPTKDPIVASSFRNFRSSSDPALFSGSRYRSSSHSGVPDVSTDDAVSPTSPDRSLDHDPLSSTHPLPDSYARFTKRDPPHLLNNYSSALDGNLPLSYISYPNYPLQDRDRDRDRSTLTALSSDQSNRHRESFQNLLKQFQKNCRMEDREATLAHLRKKYGPRPPRPHSNTSTPTHRGIYSTNTTTTTHANTNTITFNEILEKFKKNCDLANAKETKTLASTLTPNPPLTVHTTTATTTTTDATNSS